MSMFLSYNVNMIGDVITTSLIMQINIQLAQQLLNMNVFNFNSFYMKVYKLH